MRKRISALILGMIMVVMYCGTAYAGTTVPKEETPDYKVAFYASSCYHIQDENGKRSGYGYEMMQGLSKYMQCTFSYVGYDKTPQECEDMLRNGEVDIYTAAKKTPEREEEFAFSKYPAITATTCMNVKRGNSQVIAGDYATYDGLKIGLLERHTYNDKFIAFTQEKGFDCDIVYYTTPKELSQALIDDEVDAIVDSYIRTPEDEITIEDFGETAYYIMARKENQELIDQIDEAIDEMSEATPRWRSDLYNKYYGSEIHNSELTLAEQRFLEQMQADKVTIYGVMNPDNNPYSWYDDGNTYGIVADIFAETADALGLNYKILSAPTKARYEEIIASGNADIWLDMDEYYEEEGSCKYKETDPYLTTSLSMLRVSSAVNAVRKIGVVQNNIDKKEIISVTWPDAEVVSLESTDECINALTKGRIDGAVLLSYTAQRLARDDVQNRFRTEVVPGSTISIKMGINAECDHMFYQIWEKTLLRVASENTNEIIQQNMQKTAKTSLIAFLFDYPVYLLFVVCFLLFMIFFIFMWRHSARVRNEQLQITEQLSNALAEVNEANDARLNFFSKMSHDIRTPLNAILGMTQIAIKYKEEPQKLDDALQNIVSEGNYLLTMINSILDVNQLEEGHMELLHKPFNPTENLEECMSILRPLASKKEQKIMISSNFRNRVVMGDSSRFNQIIVNIVSNAIKYTNNGGEIKISLDILPNNHYRFTCIDNGIGMSEDYIKHICDDYSRAEDSRTSATEGTGLGMAVVKGFTELMNGSLSIESELGKGSKFVVEIPFEDASAKQRAILANEESELDINNYNFEGQKVLLVEDNALNAEIATELLSDVGLEVDWAENGKVGVERFEASEIGSYYAVFMDMQMPVMDGIEATKAIRALDREDNNVPIYAMTANTLIKDKKRCEQAGMNGYITKPINIKDIVRVMILQ